MKPLKLSIPAMVLMSGLLAAVTPHAPRSATAAETGDPAAEATGDQDRPLLKLGLIGCDTSHVTAFSERFHNPEHRHHVPGARVVAAWAGGSDDLPTSRDRVDGYVEALKEQHHVEFHDTPAGVVEQVDAVLVTTVDGRPRLEIAREILPLGKPVFFDKPIAGSLADAVKIFLLAEEHGVPVFTASSLHWYEGVREVAEAGVGQVTGAVSWGPSPIEPTHPDLFFYGIHPTTSLFEVLGYGCRSVVRTDGDGALVVTGRWSDGRVGTMHGMTEGRFTYQVTKFGHDGIAAQDKGGDYGPMLRVVLDFFHSGEPPISAAETLELYAFMEAADESKRRGGVPVSLREVLEAVDCPERWLPPAE